MSPETTITESDYARFKDYVAEMESAGWIVKPANEGRWVPEGEACCGPAAQIIHVRSQGGKIHMGLGERCEDNIGRAASPAALDVEAISETMWLNRHLLDAGTTGASRSAYRKVAKQIAARLTEQEERG